jgi:hypothetical protein
MITYKFSNVNPTQHNDLRKSRGVGIDLRNSHSLGIVSVVVVLSGRKIGAFLARVFRIDSLAGRSGER